MYSTYLSSLDNDDEETSQSKLFVTKKSGNNGQCSIAKGKNGSTASISTTTCNFISINTITRLVGIQWCDLSYNFAPKRIIVSFRVSPEFFVRTLSTEVPPRVCSLLCSCWLETTRVETINDCHYELSRVMNGGCFFQQQRQL